jgi:NodT family efflux transporter outer membrane factor (OMF) lipoprotein
MSRQTTSLHRVLLALAIAVVLSGCMPAHRPVPQSSEVGMPADWSEKLAAAGVIDTSWWLGFGDPALVSLVSTALANNTDILAAAARVEEARALSEIAGAAHLPTLDAAVGLQAGRSLGATGVATSRTGTPELRASWEVDLWGRLRQLAEASELRYQATRVEREAVALAVSAETVQAYIALLALDAQLDVTKATAESRAEALRLAVDQAGVGYISQLQLTQAQSEHETVLQAIPELELAIRRQENALRLLTGGVPGAVARERRFQDLKPIPIPSTLPSSLLTRRPDIVQAERLLSASDAILDARRAEFLPQVSLSASVGRLFTNGLNYDPVSIWGLGGSILAPIFSAGRLTAQVDAATASRDQAAYAYRAAVLGALNEVEGALSGVNRLRAQMEHAQKRITILERSLYYARDRYQAGYASYLEVLDAQRNLYQTQLDAIVLRRTQFNNLVSLYRSLGGGWDAHMLDDAAAE